MPSPFRMPQKPEKGQGTPQCVVRLLPPRPAILKALEAIIFVANYDPYRGTVISVRIVNGTVKTGDQIVFMSNGADYRIEELGIFQLRREPQKQLSAGQVGYIIAGVKTVSDTRPGDTITLKDRPCPAPLPGFKEVQQVVFSSLYPISTDEYEDLAAALEKLKLNDAALTFTRTLPRPLALASAGFSGFAHLEVSRSDGTEFDISLILTVLQSNIFLIYRTNT